LEDNSSGVLSQVLFPFKYGVLYSCISYDHEGSPAYKGKWKDLSAVMAFGFGQDKIFQVQSAVQMSLNE
jgi:hypothetical protein